LHICFYGFATIRGLNHTNACVATSPVVLR